VIVPHTAAVTDLGNFIIRDPRCIAALDTGSRDHLGLPKGHLIGGEGFLDSSGIVHNEATSLGPVEIFFILVVVGLVVYVLWRLLIRPRR
jgi:hypothetical protein